MATREQIQANRRNSRLSTGPKDTSLSRFNGLKHGLCAAQVGLPGEDPAEVQAEFDGWHNDWRPMTHTRAVLVDLAAVATWRLRRSIRAGSAVRARLADDAGRAFDSDRLAAVERAIDRFEDDPGAALSLLQSSALGIDRLLTSWGEMDAALEGGPSGWDQRFHLRLMILRGHPHGTDLLTAGPVPIASARLLAARKPGVRPLPAGEAEESVAALRRTAAEAMARLRERRKDVPDPGPDRRRAMEAATADTSHELRLVHRYEMDHERSLRWALRQLMALEKSGADLPEAVEAEVPAKMESEDRRDEPEKPDSTHEISTTCVELASVGMAAPSGDRPERPSETPGRPGRPTGADPGSGTTPNRR